MDELVKRLRYCSEEHSGCGVCALSDNCVLRARLLQQAADAIEKLEAFKAQITDGRFYVYKLGALFELKHDPRELVVRYQDPTEPPKEES